MLVLISGTKQGARELGPLRRTYILGVYVDAPGGGAPSGAGGSDPPPLATGPNAGGSGAEAVGVPVPRASCLVAEHDPKRRISRGLSGRGA